MLYVHIPFFGGESSAAYSDKNNRLDYLFRTIAGIKINIEHTLKERCNITLHVQNIEDFNTISYLLPEFKLINHNTSNPIFLASDCVSYIQQNQHDDDFILYTEADQVFYFNNLPSLYGVLDDSNYIAPHRIEEIPAINPRCHFPNNREFFNIKDRVYLVQNRREFNGPSYSKDSIFYLPINWDLGFGGSYLIKSKSLKKVKISYSSGLPVEHASGIDLYNTITCLKTTDILDFYCIHLSGYEMNLKGSIKLPTF